MKHVDPMNTKIPNWWLTNAKEKKKTSFFKVILTRINWMPAHIGYTMLCLVSAGINILKQYIHKYIVSFSSDVELSFPLKD